jgi:hypothetical protein
MCQSLRLDYQKGVCMQGGRFGEEWLMAGSGMQRVRLRDAADNSIA